MDFSLFYFADDSTARAGGRYDLLLQGAKYADDHEFTAVWTPERHFHAFGGLYPNPSVTGAAVAAVTTRVKVRAGSVVGPLHHPLRIAEEWAVVDNLSGGRAGVSFASGWHATDFALRPEAYADRKDHTLRALDQVQRLWRGEQIEAVDGNGRPCRLGIHPPPVQPELPVWLTSAGGIETFRAAGRAGVGVLTHLLGQDPAELATKIAAYREEHHQNGHVVLMVHTYVDEDEDRAREAVREPLTAYLRSSLGLLLGSRRLDIAKLAPDDVDFLVQQAFDRYFEQGLLGTVDKLHKTVAGFADIGVDELACLIDFGLPAADVLAGLPRLNQLRKASTW